MEVGVPPTYGQHYPPPPPGQSTQNAAYGALPAYDPSNPLPPPMPPRPGQSTYANDDISSPVHYTRDPHRLIAYLVPFPRPMMPGVDEKSIPPRFLIYTPPPPPLKAPKDGEKEDKLHKVQRKWQEEVRSAKTSTAKTASWKGVKSKATKGISWAMNQTTSADLDFVGRIDSSGDKHADDGHQEGETTKKTVGLEEMVLIFPPSLTNSIRGGETAVREEFVNSMMRTKTKAQRDAVLATGLIPVTAAIDLLATVIWPFGGLLEIDSVWAYSSIRGAKTARSVTKRLTSTNPGDHQHDDTNQTQLRLNFVPAPRIEILRQYLAAMCAEKDPKLFGLAVEGTGKSPNEDNVLEAIGWQPSQGGGETKNWEDEAWEIQNVGEDLQNVMKKGASAWDKWCKQFQKDPVKALKK